jgi:hypothetical protein
MRQPVRADAPRDRESGPGPVGRGGAHKPSLPPPLPANRFEPLPLGPAAFAPPMYSSTSEEEPSRARKWLPLFVVLGAAGAGALAIWIAVLINRPAAPAHAAGSTDGESAAASAQKAAPAAEVEKPGPIAQAAPASAKNAEAQAKAAPLPAAAPTQAAEPGAAPTAAAAAPTTDEEASSSAPLSKREEEARAKRHAARAAKTTAANLPAAPSRADVLAAMAKVAPAVQRCMSGTRGVITADMKIEGATGRVMSANVSGAPGSAGSCIAGAVRKAHFPPFAQASIAVRYPMKL